jgi:hypothetical protein
MRGAAPYRPTTDLMDGLTPGQWVRLPGYRKPGRLVRYNSDGTAVVQKPVGKGRKARVNAAAFRLARQKPVASVLGSLPVQGRTVDYTSDALRLSEIEQITNILAGVF